MGQPTLRTAKKQREDSRIRLDKLRINEQQVGGDPVTEDVAQAQKE